jgi:UDP-glucose 6-dehydrogenase
LDRVIGHVDHRTARETWDDVAVVSNPGSCVKALRSTTYCTDRIVWARTIRRQRGGHLNCTMYLHAPVVFTDVAGEMIKYASNSFWPRNIVHQ